MQLTNFEKLFDICKEFSENHEKYGFCEFDFQITIYGDRSYRIEFDFCVVGAVPIYIVPNSFCPIKDWVSDYYWMNDKGKQIVLNWILENKEVFGVSNELRNEVTTILEDTEFRRGEVLP